MKLKTEDYIEDAKSIFKGIGQLVSRKINEKISKSLLPIIKKRSVVYGIGIKKGANLIPKNDYPKDDKSYADPVNLKYRIDNGNEIKISKKTFEEFSDQYTKKEKEIILNRILEAAKEFGIEDEEKQTEKQTDLETQEKFNDFVKTLKEKKENLIFNPENNFYNNLPDELKEWTKSCKISKSFTLEDDVKFEKSFAMELVKGEGDDKGKYFLEGEASNTFVDKQREVVSDAFLKKIVQQVKKLPLLYEHWVSVDKAIGVVVNSELNGNKAMIKAKLQSPTENEEVQKLIDKRKAGIPIGLSIGGRITKSTDMYDNEYRLKYRLLEDGEIYEVSTTVLPAINKSKPIKISKE